MLSSVHAARWRRPMPWLRSPKKSGVMRVGVEVISVVIHCQIRVHVRSVTFACELCGTGGR
eukprot:8011669-Pyramimonas_sp.AAC.1